MVERDYIERMLEQFFSALYRWLKGRKQQEAEDMVSFNNELVLPYLKHDFEFFARKSFEELIDYVLNTYKTEEEQLIRLEILGELFYQQGLSKHDSLRNEYMTMTVNLLNFINSKSKIYSSSRMARLMDIRNEGLS